MISILLRCMKTSNFTAFSLSMMAIGTSLFSLTFTMSITTAL